MLHAMRFIAAVSALCLSAVSHAETLYESDEPGGPWGYWGSDIYEGQSVAARFTVNTDGDVPLDEIGLWLMTNPDSPAIVPQVTLSLRSDALDEGGPESIPSETILERWTVDVESVGFDPYELVVTSELMPQLVAGRNYWVVAESDDAALLNAVWTYAASGTAVSSLYNQGYWYPAAEAAALTLRVEAGGDGGTPPSDLTISVSPRAIVLGESALVEWSADGASRCTALGDWSGRKAATGSEAVQPTATGSTTLALSCMTEDGRKTGAARLLVLPGAARGR